MAKSVRNRKQKRLVLAEQRIRYRKPNTEITIEGVFRIFAPAKQRDGSWMCEFEAPELVEGIGHGYGEGPVWALIYACTSIEHRLLRMVDVRSPDFEDKGGQPQGKKRK